MPAGGRVAGDHGRAYSLLVNHLDFRFTFLLHLYTVEAAFAGLDFSLESFGCVPRLTVKGLQQPRGWGLFRSGRQQAPADSEIQCIHCKP